MGEDFERHEGVFLNFGVSKSVFSVILLQPTMTALTLHFDIAKIVTLGSELRLSQWAFSQNRSQTCQSLAARVRLPVRRFPKSGDSGYANIPET